jgi:hypothetical protein
MIEINGSEHNVGLTKYREKIFSQYLEDGMIREALESINSINQGFFVDVGSWDGVYLSNCHRLSVDFNFSGICIEANTERHLESIKNNLKYNVTCINSMISLEENSNLDKILENNNCPKNFELLSIDIDGIDWWVWYSLRHFSPKIVIMEYNGNHKNCSIIEYDKSYIHLNNINYYGATPPALKLLADYKGYELVGMNSLNMIFIKKELNTLPILNLDELIWYFPWANNTEKKMIEIDYTFFEKIKKTYEQ